MPPSVVVTAPVRTADVGGWTDTWFARTGAVCNVAVGPGVTVRAEPDDGLTAGTVDLVVGDAPPLRIPPDDAAAPGGDPLLVAAVRSVVLPTGARVHLTSAVPPGSGLGTSASVTVALLAALDALRGEEADPVLLAQRAHAVETGLGVPSGVQDQLAAAHGGVRLYEVTYPAARIAATLADDSGGGHRRPERGALAGLHERLLTVYLGAPHVSGAMHEAVIAGLGRSDPEPALGPMREAARAAMAALRAGDLDAYGSALRTHHDAQRRLHPGLVGTVASRVESVAAAGGARGWKVNGAGGEGGSMVVLGPADPIAHADLRAAVERVDGCRVLPLRPTPLGVTVREVTPGSPR